MPSERGAVRIARLRVRISIQSFPPVPHILQPLTYLSSFRRKPEPSVVRHTTTCLPTAQAENAAGFRPEACRNDRVGRVAPCHRSATQYGLPRLWVRIPIQSFSRKCKRALQEGPVCSSLFRQLLKPVVPAKAGTHAFPPVSFVVQQPASPPRRPKTPLGSGLKHAGTTGGASAIPSNATRHACQGFELRTPIPSFRRTPEPGVVRSQPISATTPHRPATRHPPSPARSAASAHPPARRRRARIPSAGSSRRVSIPAACGCRCCRRRSPRRPRIRPLAGTA